MHARLRTSNSFFLSSAMSTAAGCCVCCHRLNKSLFLFYELIHEQDSPTFISGGHQSTIFFFDRSIRYHSQRNNLSGTKTREKVPAMPEETSQTKKETRTQTRTNNSSTRKRPPEPRKRKTREEKNEEDGGGNVPFPVQLIKKLSASKSLREKKDSASSQTDVKRDENPASTVHAPVILAPTTATVTEEEAPSHKKPSSSTTPGKWTKDGINMERFSEFLVPNKPPGHWEKKLKEFESSYQSSIPSDLDEHLMNIINKPRAPSVAGVDASNGDKDNNNEPRSTTATRENPESNALAARLAREKKIRDIVARLNAEELEREENRQKDEEEKEEPPRKKRRFSTEKEENSDGKAEKMCVDDDDIIISSVREKESVTNQRQGHQQDDIVSPEHKTDDVSSLGQDSNTATIKEEEMIRKRRDLPMSSLFNPHVDIDLHALERQMGETTLADFLAAENDAYGDKPRVPGREAQNPTKVSAIQSAMNQVALVEQVRAHALTASQEEAVRNSTLETYRWLDPQRVLEKRTVRDDRTDEELKNEFMAHPDDEINYDYLQPSYPWSFARIGDITFTADLAGSIARKNREEVFRKNPQKVSGTVSDGRLDLLNSDHVDRNLVEPDPTVPFSRPCRNAGKVDLCDMEFVYDPAKNHCMAFNDFGVTLVEHRTPSEMLRQLPEERNECIYCEQFRECKKFWAHKTNNNQKQKRQTGRFAYSFNCIGGYKTKALLPTLGNTGPRGPFINHCSNRYKLQKNLVQAAGNKSIWLSGLVQDPDMLF